MSATKQDLSDELNAILGTEIDFTKLKEDELEMLIEILKMWKDEIRLDPNMVVDMVKGRLVDIIDARATRMKENFDKRASSQAEDGQVGLGIAENIIDSLLNGEEEEKPERKRAKRS